MTVETHHQQRKKEGRKHPPPNPEPLPICKEFKPQSNTCTGRDRLLVLVERL